MNSAEICLPANQRPLSLLTVAAAPATSANLSITCPALSRWILQSSTAPFLPVSSMTSSRRSMKNSLSSRSSLPLGSNMFFMSTYCEGGACGLPGGGGGAAATGSVGIAAIDPKPPRTPSPMPIPSIGAGASATRETMMRLPASSRPLIAVCASLASDELTKVMFAMPIPTPVDGSVGIEMSATCPKGEKTSLMSSFEMCGCSSDTTSLVGSAAGPLPPIIALAAATFFAACASRFFSAIDACTSSGCPLKAMPLSASAFITDAGS
mmetsp:Transcript_15405/g.38650  ORF Transcript_15405/g.38650 Transcript_15405/m.38650 type:complete len:266 (-) Transcript_15405:1216-2013(-)